MALQESVAGNIEDTEQKVEQDFQQWLRSLPKHSFVGFLALPDQDDPRKAAYARALADTEKTCDDLLSRHGLNPDKFREKFYRDVVKRLAENIIDRKNLGLETEDPPAGIYTGTPYSEGEAPKRKVTRLRERRSGKDRRKCVVFFEVERRKESRREGKERRGGVYAKKK